MYINLQGHGAESHVAPGYDYDQQHQPEHENYGKPHYETAYPMGASGNAPQYSYSQAAQTMQYAKPPPQQMETEEKKESKCCVVLS